jgi:hypothetical protein
LKPAVNQATKLKELGRQLQALKEKTDSLKEAITKEERDELAKNYRKKLQDALVGLDKAQTEMDQAIRRAEEKGPREAVDELKNTLKLVQGEFEVLAKQ